MVYFLKVPKHWEYIWWSILSFITILVLLSPSYLRGTDQYWYISETNAVANGFHTGTNYLFPNSFSGNWDDPQRPFVQNRPVVYIAGLLTICTKNAVFSWKLINLFSIILTALLVRKAAELFMLKQLDNIAAKQTGILIGLLYLALPFNYWLVFQPFTTLFDTFVAAFIFLWILPHWIAAKGNLQIKWWLILLIASIIFVYERKDHLLMLILGIVTWLWARKQIISKYLLFIPVLILGVIVCAPVFPDHLIVRFPLYRFILEARKGSNNMVAFFDPYIDQYSPGELFNILIPKAIRNIKKQIVPPLQLFQFYLITNIFILFVIVGLANQGKMRRNAKLKSFCWMAFGIILSYLILIIVFQNHYRYMGSILPVIIAVGSSIFFYLFGNKYYKRRIYLFSLSVIFCLFIADAAIIVLTLRKNKQEQVQSKLLGRELNKYVNPDEPLLCEYVGGSQLVIAFMHSSAPCLYIDERFVIERSEILDDSRIKWVVTYSNSKVRAVIQNRILASYVLPRKFVLNKIKD